MSVAVEYDVSDWNFEPTPEYEYCAPLDGNRYVGDDSSALIFDPLSNTRSGARHNEFLDLHDDLAWTTLADPAGRYIYHIVPSFVLYAYFECVR